MHIYMRKVHRGGLTFRELRSIRKLILQTPLYFRQCIFLSDRPSTPHIQYSKIYTTVLGLRRDCDGSYSTFNA